MKDAENRTLYVCKLQTYLSNGEEYNLYESLVWARDEFDARQAFLSHNFLPEIYRDSIIVNDEPDVIVLDYPSFS